MIILEKFIYTNCAELHHTLPDSTDITLAHLSNRLIQMKFTCRFRISPIEMIWLKSYVGYTMISEHAVVDAQQPYSVIDVSLGNSFMSYISSSVSNIIQDTEPTAVTEEIMLNGLNERLDIINANINSVFMQHMGSQGTLFMPDLFAKTVYGRYCLTLKGLQYVADKTEHTSAYVNLGIRSAVIRKASMLSATSKIFGSGETHMDVSQIEVVAGMPWGDYLSNIPHDITPMSIYCTAMDLKRAKNEMDDPASVREYLDEYNTRLINDPREIIYSRLLYTGSISFYLGDKPRADAGFDISGVFRSLVISATDDLHQLYVDNNK